LVTVLSDIIVYASRLILERLEVYRDCLDFGI
jgi:hypothetical protein